MNHLDTDVLIDVQRGHPPALAWFTNMTNLSAVSGYVVMELVQDARNAKEVRNALKLVAPLQIIWPTESDCTRALADFSVYHLSHGLGLLDALIIQSTKSQRRAIRQIGFRPGEPAWREPPGFPRAECRPISSDNSLDGRGRMGRRTLHSHHAGPARRSHSM